MAFNTADITAKVQRRIRDTSYSASEIRDYINDALNDIYNEYQLTFMQASQTYTVPIGNSDITDGEGIPLNYVKAIKLIETTNGQEKEIPYIEEAELDVIYPDHGDTVRYANGQPQYWYHDGFTIRLFPAPAAAYTLKLRYYKKPALLAADESAPELPSEFEELLVLGAAYRVLQAKDNYDQAGIFENKCDELKQKLVARYSRPQTAQVQLMPGNFGHGRRVRPIDSYHRIG